MKLRRYKNVYVGKGSALAEALEKSEAEAKKVYEATGAAFLATYKDSAAWFYSKAKEME
jgi:hypothetical protein